jgi:putative FmdB family regulatory protein
MPIHEYECSKGCPPWEEIQKMGDKPKSVCPTCNKKTAKRLISTGGFILKGRGFHRPSRQESDNEIN